MKGRKVKELGAIVYLPCPSIPGGPVPNWAVKKHCTESVPPVLP